MNMQERKANEMKVLKQAAKILLHSSLCLAMVVGMVFVNLSFVSAHTADTYEIYPVPHHMQYDGSDFVLKENVNVVFEDGIDAATRDRLHEILRMKSLTAFESAEVKDGTNILIGTYGSNQTVDAYTKTELGFNDESLFQKYDAYYMSIHDGTIVILGKDTTAAFYGLATLYHIFAQTDSKTISNLTIQDYADVRSRGFIEG